LMLYITVYLKVVKLKFNKTKDTVNYQNSLCIPSNQK